MQQMAIPNQQQQQQQQHMLPPSYAAAGAAGSGFPILDVASATAPADASNEAPPATAGDPVRQSCAMTSATRRFYGSHKQTRNHLHL
jgi:hypothetical protein